MNTSETDGWNPRYVAYAKAHGKTPQEMFKHNRDNHCVYEFVLWNSARWIAFHEAQHGKRFRQYDCVRCASACHNGDYDKWLFDNLGETNASPDIT